MTICHVAGCTAHYGCRLRAKAIQLSPLVTISRTQNWRASEKEPSSMNAQIIYDERPGGTKMPFLHADGSVVRAPDIRGEHRKPFENLVRSNRDRGLILKE